MAFSVIETITEFDYENDATRNPEWAVVTVVEIGSRRSGTQTRIDLRRMYEDENGNDRPGKGITFRSTEELEALIKGLQTGLKRWKEIEGEKTKAAAKAPARKRATKKPAPTPRARRSA